MPAITPCPAELRQRFAQIVGADNLRDDEASLRQRAASYSPR